MKPAERDLMIARAVYDLPVLLDQHDREARFVALIESLPETSNQAAQKLRGEIEAEVWEARKKHEAALCAEVATARAEGMIAGLKRAAELAGDEADGDNRSWDNAISNVVAAIEKEIALYRS